MIKFIGKSSNYPSFDIHYSTAKNQDCYNTFTGYVLIKNSVKHPIYRFEYGTHGCYYNTDDKGNFQFVNLPDSSEPAA